MISHELQLDRERSDDSEFYLVLFSVQVIKQTLYIFNSSATILFVLWYVDYLVLNCCYKHLCDWCFGIFLH